jgi:hypothetical protein
VPSGVIAFTVSGQREKYLRQVLGSWGRVRGIDSWHLLFCVEPGYQFPVPEFTAWVQRVFASAEVMVNPERLGCLRNTRHAMREAFGRGAEFAILAEEDCKVSDDVLEYFAWARDAYAADENVTAVCAHSLRTEAGSDDEVVLGDWFNPIVWGTWKDRWESFIEPGWGFYPGNEESWDNNLRVQIRDAGRRSVFPVRSRSVHIGEVSTQHRYDLAAYFYRTALSSSFAASRESRAEFTEIPFSRKLGLWV